MRDTQPLLHCIVAVLLSLSLRTNANIPDPVIPVTINEKYCRGGGAEWKQRLDYIQVIMCNYIARHEFSNRVLIVQVRFFLVP